MEIVPGYEVNCLVYSRENLRQEISG